METISSLLSDINVIYVATFNDDDTEVLFAQLKQLAERIDGEDPESLKQDSDVLVNIEAMLGIVGLTATMAPSTRAPAILDALVEALAVKLGLLQVIELESDDVEHQQLTLLYPLSDESERSSDNV